jgi:hypothetical protein
MLDILIGMYMQKYILQLLTVQSQPTCTVQAYKLFPHHALHDSTFS